jgi:putative ABC transport system substrate-binding protein
MTLALVLGLLALPLAAQAQRPADVPRIGYLVLSPLALSPTAEREAFLQGLRDLGYVEGKNVVIEYRSAAWNRELLPDLADELVSLKVNVIVAVPGTIEAARDATKTIPIVVPAMGDPTETGLVASLARPGGNITGTTGSFTGMAAKRLQLLKEAVPKVSRVAVLWNPANYGEKAQWRETQAAARTLGVTAQSFEVTDPKDFPAAFAAMSRERADALVTTTPGALITAYRPFILEFSAKKRLPTLFTRREEVEAGGLMAYGADIPDLFRRTATYVDRILKGAKPGDLPIEQPTKFELVVNLKTAKALRLTIPPSVLLRADRVIE